MASRKTWLWILVGGFAAVVVGLVALAAAGVYLITRHVETRSASAGDAQAAFEDVTRTFADPTPLYTLDENEEPRLSSPLSERPTAAEPVTQVAVLVWDPHDDRLMRLSIPIWILQLGDGELDVAKGGQNWQVDQLKLDVDELARTDPAVVFDYRDAGGARVLVWTH